MRGEAGAGAITFRARGASCQSGGAVSSDRQCPARFSYGGRSCWRNCDAAFISVDPGDSADALADRRSGLGGTAFPFAIDATGTLAARYGIAALGTVIVYDATGRIVSRVVEPSLQELRAGFREAGVR